MRISWIKFLLSLFITAGSIVPVRSAEEKALARISGSGIATGNTVLVYDSKYNPMINGLQATWGFVNNGANGYVEFGIDHSSTVYVSSPEYVELSIDISYSTYNYTTNAFVAQTPISTTLTIDYDETVAGSIDKVIYKIPDAHYLSVEITGISDGTNPITAPGNLYLEPSVSVERYYEFDHTFLPVLLQHEAVDVDQTIAATKDELVISWGFIPGAEEYHLEYTFISSLTGERVLGVMQTNAASSVSFSEEDFYRNCTRVVTTDHTYTIPLLFEPGFLIYRVRGVGKGGPSAGDYSHYIYGKWSSDDGITKNDIGDFPHYYEISVGNYHEENFNWQSTATFAEEGKRKDVISYFDGSLRNRQTVTKINSDNNVIAGESLYDYQGRPAVQVLPVPVGGSVIKYYTGVSMYGSTVPYTKEHFDEDVNPATCSLTVTPMDTTNGLAAIYYSGSNAITQSHQMYIPSAEGYPFVQIEYEPDNTGRIRRQSGVGANHTLSGSHATRYFYGQPEQEQLDRLFGSEVGYAQHYKKNMVIDANGQISVSYMDMHGRVIATAVAGDSLGNLRTLRNPANNNPLTSESALSMNVDLLAKDNAADIDDTFDNNNVSPDGKSLTYSATKLVTSEDTYTFTYTLDNTHYTDDCMLDNTCYPLVYDIGISMLDACGIEMLNSGNGYETTVNSNYELNPVNCGQSVDVDLDNTDGLTTLLTPGSYQLVKKITVNEDALDYFTARYMADLDTNSCALTLHDFITVALDSVQTSPCPMTCTECVDNLESILGTRTVYIDAVDPNNLTAEEQARATEWDNIYNDCMEACTSPNLCETRYNMMLLDVSPYGQYGKLSGLDYNVSVFNENNQLSYAPPTANTSWKSPVTPYLGTDGLQSYVEVIHVNNGIYNPAVDGNAVIHTINGLTYVVPEDLADVNDFVSYFGPNPQWAQSLVYFHPEYAYYRECVKTLEISGNITAYTSQEYDDAILLAETFAEAQSIDIGTAVNLDISQTLLQNDPFFATGAPGANYYSVMNTAISNFQGNASLSIYDAAVITVNCGSYFGQNYSTCIGANTYGSQGTAIDDAEWEQAKFYYLSIKQQIMHEFWDDYMLATWANNNDDEYYCGCIGQLPSLYQNSHPSTFYTTQISSSEAPCSWYNWNKYEDKQRRFYVPDLNNLVTTSGFQLYQQTGLCPEAFDVVNLLNEMAVADLLKATAEPLQNHFAFNSNLYKLVSGLTPGSNNYVSYSWTGSVPGANTTLSVAIGGTPNTCSGAFLTLTIPPAALLNWTNYPANWTINQISQIYPLTATTFEVKAFVDHDNSTFTADEVWIFTGTLSSCFDLTGCTFPDECPPSDAAIDMQELMNLLSVTVLTDINSASHSLTGIEVDIVESHLAWYLQGATSYTWSKSGNDYSITGNNGKYIRVNFSTAFSNGDLFSNVQGDPSTPGIKITHTSGTNVTERTGTFVWYDGTTTHSLSAGYCGDPVPIACQTPEHEMVTTLEELLNAFAPSGNAYLEPDNTNSKNVLTGSPFWSNDMQTALDLTGSDVFVAKGTISSSLFNIPIILDSDYSSSDPTAYCTIDLQYLNTGSIDFTDITGFSNLEPDFSQTTTGGYTYTFTVLATTATDSYYLTGTTCFPLAKCDDCIPEPLQPFSCEEVMNEYDDYLKNNSLPSDFDIDPETFCSDGFQDCALAYLDYLTALGISETTDPGYMTLNDFCLNGYNTCSPGYNSLIAMLFPSSLNTGSVMYITLPEFCAGMFSSSCITDYDAYCDLGSPTLTIEEFCAGYPQEAPCIASPVLNPPDWPETSQPTFDCDTYANAVAVTNGTANYQTYLANMEAQFRQAYIDKCIQDAVETFRMQYQDAEYHFTLYYYDQGGNLVRTVPPQGVSLIDLGAIFTGSTTNGQQILADRAANTQNLKTAHAFTTTYTYNSLNQLKAQNTPDGGESEFWYDRLGRIVVSQNAKQAANDDYSYTVYDELGRVEQAGQANNASAMTPATASDDSGLATWISNSTLTEITKTYYDEVDATVFTGMPFPDGQLNLRNRIAHVAAFETETDLTNDDYYHATHYSYDIHGNVSELVQDNPQMETHLTGQQYKYVSYTYDLLSGNVHEVAYQPGEADQYYHRYWYDADNRITNVFTSTDDVNWDQDAKYFYYKHGPLARTEIAHNKAQGTDFAYTIQGWLKGVNSNTLYASRDMGKDGNTGTNLNEFIAQDAYGYSLSYYEGDYKNVGLAAAYGLTGTSNFLADDSPATYISTDAPDLYNGNIRYMVTTIKNSSGTTLPQLTAYRYDQLNRIKQMKAYRDIDAANNKWNNGSTYDGAFEEHYVYDHNGNILQLNRNGNATDGLDMDVLQYYYYKSDGTIFSPQATATPSNATNKLAYVDDASTLAPTAYGDDIEDMETSTVHHRYQYDAIGQLISDDQEEIANITWTVQGKVKKVIRTSASTKDDLEFIYDAMGRRVAKIIKPDGTSVENGGTDLPADWEYTYYAMDASGNVLSTYNRAEDETDFYLEDQTIYGSSREGVINRNLLLNSATVPTTEFKNKIGDKQYQLSNHLGNVLTTISDVKVPVQSGGTITGYTAKILSATDYSSFGAPMPGRTFVASGGEYRYGFNGMEKDDEMKGNGNSYTSEFRQYDPRLGRWLSIDPMSMLFPDLSVYNNCANNPIWFVDTEGDIYRVYYTEKNESTGETKERYVDFNGTKAQFEDGTEYTMGTNGFVDDVITSYNYIVDNGADINGALEHVASATEITNVRYVKNPDKVEYDPKTETIFWNPNSALDIVNEDGSEGIQSAAIGFLHESAHRYIELTYTEEAKKELEKQHNFQKEPGVLKEEYEIMEKFENPAVEVLKDKGYGETARDTYGQAITWTDGPTSTTVVAKKEIKEELNTKDQTIVK